MKNCLASWPQGRWHPKVVVQRVGGVGKGMHRCSNIPHLPWIDNQSIISIISRNLVNVVTARFHLIAFGELDFKKIVQPI